jgi:hypothetical protein
MADQQSTPVVRCDMCRGTEADGVDEYGLSFCPRCAGRLRGDREGEVRGLAVMLGAAVAGALLEGLPVSRVRDVVESEIAAGSQLKFGEEEDRWDSAQ